MLSLVKLLGEQELTISTCESFTGGLMASEICNIPGASKVFMGGFVAYSQQAKIDVVHVDFKLLDQYGTISPQVVSEMAEKTRIYFQTDLAIAFSGNAGPSPQENKPVGLWYGAIADSKHTEVFGGICNLERNDLRKAAVEIGRLRLLDKIRNMKK